MFEYANANNHVTRTGLLCLFAILLLGNGANIARAAAPSDSAPANPLRTVSTWTDQDLQPLADMPDDALPPEPPAELWDDQGLRPLAPLEHEAPCCNADCGGGCWYTPRLWAQADALLWWSKGQQSPALVTTSPDGTPRDDAGVLGRPGTHILHGGELLDTNGRLGGRLNIGMWLDDCHCTAIEATWLVLGDGGNTGNFYAQSIGDPVSPILARPFFNTQTNQQDAELAAFPDVIIGDIQVETSSELNSISVLARRNYCRGLGGSFDVVGGYRYLRFREGLMVTEGLTSIDDGGVVPVGTEFLMFDSFATNNEFHGGEVGLSLLYECGPWTLDVLGKVAMGNMRQTVTINGSTTTISPTDPPLVSEGALLALPTNIGRSQRDEFTVIPELNLNLRYYWNPRFSMTVGYSLLWITNVARAGDQIDFQVNPTQLPTGGGAIFGDASPRRQLNDTSMWFQGLNFGCAWQY